MIEAVVTLYQFGLKSRPRRLGILHIVNDGTGGRDLGNYNVVVYDGRNDRVARVEGFRRKERGWLPLLRLAVTALESKEGIVQAGRNRR